MAEDISDYGAGLRRAATAGRVRAVVVLAGERAWAWQAAETLAGADALWLSDRAPQGQPLPAAQAHTLLGRELDSVVFDAWAGFDVEAFGSVVGAVRAGSLFILITPPLAAWPAFADPQKARIAVHPWLPEQVPGRFIARLATVLRTAPGVTLIEQGGALPPLPAFAPASGLPSRNDACITADQCAAVAALEHVVHGHRRRPAVLISDRGRGKSSALGIAAARLLRQGLARIVISGPRIDAVDAAFTHAARLLPDAETARGRLRWGKGELSFVPPDALAHSAEPADLVLVDEAAAIPTPLLEQLLRRYSRIAFATTVHGYEGTGRGFAVRFHKVLNDKTPGWNRVRLETPVRWAPDDPLEQLAFRALLLDASPAADDALAALPLDACHIEQLDRDHLVNDEPLLSQLFGLLVLAHYQTSPLDLRHLLDGPNVTVWVARIGGQVAATALVAAEGGFDAELARAVRDGKRRPRGHLIPQSLAVHAGFVEAPLLRCARIMRIAVHPALQGRGLGRSLVAAIVAQAEQTGIDYLGSSFGATTELLRFWEQAGFLPVRVGFSREAASGTHSAMVLHPLATAAPLLERVRRRFLDHLPLLLSDALRDLEPGLAVSLLAGHAAPPLDALDCEDIRGFAHANRDYGSCSPALWKFALGLFAQPEHAQRLSEAEQMALLAKVVQKRSWADLARLLEVPGQKRVVALLREAVRTGLAAGSGACSGPR